MDPRVNESYKVFAFIDRGFMRNICAVSLAKTPYFYSSTGFNSGNKGTWFPCYGVSQEGWFIKQDPSFISFPKNLIKFLNSKFSDYEMRFPLSEEKMKSLEPSKNLAGMELNSFLERFANIESLLFSYAIGGGYWETENSKVLRQYLDARYSEALKQINYYCPEIKVLKNLTTVASNDTFNVDLSKPFAFAVQCTELQTKLELQRDNIKQRLDLLESDLAIPAAPPLPHRNPKRAAPPLIPIKPKDEVTLSSQNMFSKLRNDFWTSEAIRKPTNSKDIQNILDDYRRGYCKNDNGGSATLELKKEVATLLLDWLNGKNVTLTAKQADALKEKSYLGDIFEQIKTTEFYKNNSTKLNVEAYQNLKPF